VAGCSAKFSQTAAARQQTSKRTAKTRPAAKAPAATPQAAPAAAPQKTVPLLPVDPVKTVTDAIDKLLEPLRGPVKKVLGGTGADGRNDGSGLLGFLLG
jgi:hypothetical protein